jgi:hypothetical protein
MSIIDTIDAFDKLEYNDLRSFAAATALIAKSIEEYNNDPSANIINGLQLLYENEYVDKYIYIQFRKIFILEHRKLQLNKKISNVNGLKIIMK